MTSIALKSQRNSNTELLRIFAMFCIIIYHLLAFFVSPESQKPIYRALQIPFHIGVILFVLISGYYGIKISLKGLIKLVLPLIFYYFFAEIIGSIIQGSFTWGSAFKTAFFISNSPYWYVRTYLWLFLLSPVINKYLCLINDNQRKYLLITLGIISVYFGSVGGDQSLVYGQNIINFLFLYVIGNTISNKHNISSRIGVLSLVAIFAVINVATIVIFLRFPSLSELIMKACFFYCSPLLIFNSVLVFLVFNKFSFRSSLINCVASSTYSMYIIHHIPIILYGIIGPLLIRNACFDNLSLTLLILVVFTLVIMLVSFMIDQAFKPLFNLISMKLVSSFSSLENYMKGIC